MEEKLVVAAVLKPLGIRGEIKVKVLLDDAEDFKAFKRVFVGGEEYGVLGVRAQGEFAYVALRGVADRNAAELLRGKDIEVYKSELPALPEGRYYIADLIGCEVFACAASVTADKPKCGALNGGASGERLGEVIAVTPARTDIYTLSTPKGEVSFAAAEGVIESVDVLAKRITVNKKRFKEVSVY